MKLILASSSPSRLSLLSSIQIKVAEIVPADIDETPLSKELPSKLAKRLAIEKADKVSKKFDNAFILAADTVTACGRKILPKALNDCDVRECMNILSGRRHSVYTGVAINKVKDSKIIKSVSKIITTIVRFKKLEHSEIEEYIKSSQGINKSGGCCVEGLCSAYINFTRGSHSNIMGLPLHETYMMLKGLGYKNKDEL